MRTKQVRPEKTDYEFELYLSKRINSMTRNEYILFDFRTVKIFENFNYKITVEPKINIENRELEFNLEGLSAPVVALSKDGYADFKFKLEEFVNGEYTLKLIKQRKVKYIFKIKISKSGIKITKKSSKKFVNVIIQQPRYVSQTI
jgi:hypothetical protein